MARGRPSAALGRGQVPHPAVGAEVGLSLALDAGDKGRVEGVALAAVPPLAEAPEPSLFSRWLLQAAERLGGAPGGSNLSAGPPPSSISLASQGGPRLVRFPQPRTPPLKRFSSEASTLQWIDRRVGVPVCLLLTLFRRIGDLLGGPGPGGPVSSILILKLAEQGSTVLAHEAIRRAVARVGRDNVHFLVFEENRFIVDLTGLIPRQNVHEVRTGSAWAMMASGIRVLSAIRRRRFDACIDMEFFARFSAAIAYLTGARNRAGFHSYFGEGPYRGDLMTHRVLYNPHLHTSRTFTSLVLALD